MQSFWGLPRCLSQTVRAGDHERTPTILGSMSPPNLLPVVLCGGSGTRLWPLSREAYPKQFLSLLGPRSLLQDTLLRISGALKDCSEPLAPLLVCNTEHRFVVAEQLQGIGAKGARILLEPAGRNTAPALTLAALQALEDGEGADPVLLAMPADHAIADLAAFHAAIRRALPVAVEGSIVTFGITPDRAETGYGYIRCASLGAGLGSGGDSGEVHRILHFAEKPDAQAAQAYLESGEYLWNSGFFMVRARQWLKAIAACRPDILQACTDAMRASVRDLDFIRPDTSAFQACPSDSIDYAVMERILALPHLGVSAHAVSLSAGWSDIGAWDALWAVLEQDGAGNVDIGDVLRHDCEGSLLVSSGRLVAGVGLKDMVVVETPDAVLVVDRRRTQDVRHVVSQLRQSGHEVAQLHRKVHRPWGWYDTIDRGECFQVKRIVLHPGAQISLQMHHRRAEHWVVVRGTAEITNGERTYALGPNESTYIPMGQVHRLANPGQEFLEIIEVQSGDYLGEDDIVRFDDLYGRSRVSTPGFEPVP